MHFTSYMKDCCTFLSQHSDVPSDQLIAPFIEIQVLQRKISEAFCLHDISTCNIRGERGLQITVDSFSRDIDGLKKSIASASTNLVLVQQLRFLEVWIREIGLSNEVWQSTVMHAGQPEIDTSIQFSIQRTNMLWQLVAATVSFHDWCLSVDSSQLRHFPFSWWADHSYVLIVQVRIVFLNLAPDTQGKQNEHARRHGQADLLEADFRRAAANELMIPPMLDLYMAKLATVSTQLTDDNGVRDTFHNYRVLLKSIQSGYESRIGTETRHGLGQNIQQPNVSRPSHPEATRTNIHLSTPLTSNGNHMALEMGDLHSSSTSQSDMQFDLPELGQMDSQSTLTEPALDDFVWDTMMNNFSFFTPQNGPPL